MNTVSIKEIQKALQPLLRTYGFLGAVLFGSYASGTATEDSDIDLYLRVPEGTKTKNVFAFAYDLGEVLGKTIDAYGSHEVPVTSNLYNQIHAEGVALWLAIEI